MTDTEQWPTLEQRALMAADMQRHSLIAGILAEEFGEADDPAGHITVAAIILHTLGWDPSSRLTEEGFVWLDGHTYRPENATHNGYKLSMEFQRVDVPIIEDSHGSSWSKCGPACDLHVVRPGSVQCDAADTGCPNYGVCMFCGRPWLDETSPFHADPPCRHCDDYVPPPESGAA